MLASLPGANLRLEEPDVFTNLETGQGILLSLRQFVDLLSGDAQKLGGLFGEKGLLQIGRIRLGPDGNDCAHTMAGAGFEPSDLEVMSLACYRCTTPR